MMCPSSPPHPPQTHIGPIVGPRTHLLQLLKPGQKQLLFCMKAFSYHPELPGGLDQTTTLRENPTPGGA